MPSRGRAFPVLHCISTQDFDPSGTRPEPGLPKGFLPVDPEVAAIARGDVPGLQRVVDHARFHLFDYTGLAGDPSATLWGEASPTEIPLLDGVRYVVIAPPLFGNRSWDSGFFANFHDALRSRIHPTPLSETELADVLARLPRS